MKNLSYLLGESTPCYGDMGAVRIVSARQMRDGDTSNSMTLELPNHCGTHIDAPRHFDPSGKVIADFDPSFWFASPARVHYMGLPPEEGALIAPDDLAIEANDAEALLIVTGWWRRRGEEAYRLRGPGLHPALADFLRERMPRLKFVGFDFISVSSFLNRPVGREAHRAFLAHPRPILPIEDMDLSTVVGSGFGEMIVAPLMLEGGDGAPVTVFVR